MFENARPDELSDEDAHQPVETTGRLEFIASATLKLEADMYSFKKAHFLSITAVLVSNDAKHVYSASKDGVIVKWTMQGGKVLVFKIGGGSRHVQIYALALSFDNVFLAAGGLDCHIYCWSAETGEYRGRLRHHSGPVTGLAFRKVSDDHVLYSSSCDKTIRVWSVDEMAYLESLFGHENQVLGVDALSREVCVSPGSFDQTVRLWKIVDQKHLMYKSPESCGSVECVSMIDNCYFVSGTDAGSIMLWNTRQKKPLVHVRNAHDQGVTSLASLKYTEIFASGSLDCIKIWKISPDFGSIESIFSASISGYANSLAFGPLHKELVLIVGMGQEMRLGRWDVHKHARNIVYRLSFKNE